MFEWLLHNFRGMVRDKSSLFFNLVFPVLMVFILGNMLQSLDNADSPIGTIKISYFKEEVKAGGSEGYSIEEHMGQVAEATAVRSFMDGLAENEGIETAIAASPEAARAMAASGEADAAMIFSSPLSIEVTEGENIYKNRAVVLMAQSFARIYATFNAAALHDIDAFLEVMADGVPEFSGLTEDKDLGVNRSMIDYYAVTMVVMIIFMGGGIGGATAIYQARQDGMLRRITLSTRSRPRLFLESVAGTLPQNIMQAGVVMALSTIFMGATYAQTWQGNMLIFGFFLILGLAVGAVFMVVGLFVRVNPYLPILAAMWTLLFISGTFSKEMFIKGFSEYLPMNIVQTAIFDLTVFGRSEQLLLVTGVSAIVLIGACALGSALYKRKELMF